MRLYLALCLPLVCLFVVTVSELAEPSNENVTNCENGVCPQEDSLPIQIQRIVRGHSNVRASRPAVRHAASCQTSSSSCTSSNKIFSSSSKTSGSTSSARPSVRQARRPSARRAPVRQARRPAARSAPRRPARRPSARRAPVHQARRPAPRRPAPRNRPQPQANQAQGGKPIGPNQIRLTPETVAIKELMLATTKAKEVSAKFSKIKGSANTIMNGMNEVSKLMDEESGTVSHIQMRMVGVRAKFLSGWMDKAKSVASSVKDMMNDVKEATEQARSVLGLINKHKNSIKGKDNFSKTIASFAVDFGKHVEDGEQIQKDMEPTSSALSVVVSGSGGDISSIKIKFNGALEDFKKIKIKVEMTSDSLVKVTIDLQNSVNEGGRNGDVPAVREPETSKPRKPDDGGTKPKPDDGGTKPKPDDGGTKPKPDDGGTKPKPEADKTLACTVAGATTPTEKEKV
ncbi:hypothetical protein M3Y97_01054500 [Aphelenchoides bicaudatus]|nr:hypothetical protein M3Y97_01054500 [Aphelenchoides bicaudatus]